MVARLSGHFEHQKGMEEHGGDAAEGPEIHGPLQLLGRDGPRSWAAHGIHRYPSPGASRLAILKDHNMVNMVDFGVAKSVDPTQ
jgi:hypothetical protein